MNAEENIFERKPMILVVDDEFMIQEILKRDFQPKLSVCDFQYVGSLKEASDRIASGRVDLLLLDKEFGQPGKPGYQNGIKAIPRLLALQPEMQIIVLTASHEINDCVEAMNLGARTYVTKDTEPEILWAHIEKALDGAKIAQEKQKLETLIRSDEVVNLAGRSSAIRSLRVRLRKAALSQRPVLLLGETGTGKTTAARLIHQHRRNELKKMGCFHERNIAELPSTLLERELFGNEKGAYSGAVEAKSGLFEAADGGTLFLDEIGEASMELQTKLLRVLETGAFRRLGSNFERKSNFKLVCATNQNLEELITQKRFRMDLYMRIAVLKLDCPSLDQRKEDIPDIVRSLLPRVCRENGVQVSFRQLPVDFMDYLCRNSIPGNIRGVEQMLSNLMTFCPRDRNRTPLFDNWKDDLGITNGTVMTDDSIRPITMDELRARSIQIDREHFMGLKEFMKELSDLLIQNVYHDSGTIRKAAGVLGIHHSSLSYRLKGMHPAAKGGSSL